MQLIRQLPKTSDRPRAVAIGNFDGLHLGHQQILATMCRAAVAHDAVPSVLTFAPHPRRFFAPASPPFALMRPRDKLQGLASHGVADIVMPRFDAAFAAMAAELFLDKVLGTQLGARVVVTGENFSFGHKRGGNAAMLHAWGCAHGVEIITVPPVMVAGNISSSSAVREALAHGDMALVTQLLGRHYTLRGRVVRGEGRGRPMGFATANMAPAPGLLLPALGVYAVRATLGNTVYAGVANIGIRPTVSVNKKPSIEVHLFDTVQEIYGQTLRIALVHNIRREAKFENIDALRAQIAKDCIAARLALSGTP
jgi:riboflavin kinase / FMN adenylyltransferase